MSKPEPKKRPIIFNTQMVRAILDGHKTQTRRVIKPQADAYTGDALGQPVIYPVNGNSVEADTIKPPYGIPGDELWVRETFALNRKFEGVPPSEVPNPYDQQVFYKADHEENYPMKYRPSIYMPRWASRIKLLVKDVKVDRLKHIDPEDIEAEGIMPDTSEYNFKGNEMYHALTIREKFKNLWDSINADRGYSWESNPWVWVVKFKVKEVKR